MSLTVTLKVVPSSGRQEFIFEASGQLKCFIKSSPEKGKANQELIKILSKALDLPSSVFSILVGAMARKKTIKIEAPITFEEFFKRLKKEKKGGQRAIFSMEGD